MKSIRWLVVALIVAAGVWGGLELRTRAGSGPQPLFPDYRPESAGRITIKAQSGLTELDKRGQVWLVTSEDSLPVAQQPLEDLLGAVGAFSRKDRISSRLERQAQYQVDSTGVAVTVADERGRQVASFVVGKTGPDYQSTYIRDTRTNDVILAPGRLSYIFDRGGRPWQDRRVFSVDAAGIAEIGISKPAGPIVLRRDEAGKWLVSEPESAGCDPGAASRLVKTLASLENVRFAGRAPLPEWGLDAAEPSVWVKTTAGETQGLAVGAQDEEGRYYAVRTDGPQPRAIHLISALLVERILPDLADLLPKAAVEAPDGAQGQPAASTAGQPAQPQAGPR